MQGTSVHYSLNVLHDVTVIFYLKKNSLKIFRNKKIQKKYQTF